MSILIHNLESKEWNAVDYKAFTEEEELKRLLVESPKILPAEDLEVSFVVAIPEFGLGTGSADILAFSTDGDVAIIECKLSSNPDIKRRVVGQILEYASYLWGMSYEQIDGKVNEKQGKSLAELVRNKAEGQWDEENFREGVKNSLEKGGFFLVVAVDKINEELKRTVQYLNGCGNPAYSIYALEMRRFKQDNIIEILIPHIYPESKVTPPPLPPPLGNWEKFLRYIKENLQPEVVAVVEQLYNWAENEELIKIDFGKGKTGSILFYLRDISPSLFSISGAGVLWFNYGWLSKVVDENAMKEFHRLHGIKVPDDFSKFPSVKVADAFVDKPEAVEKFKEAIIWLAKEIKLLTTGDSS